MSKEHDKDRAPDPDSQIRNGAGEETEIDFEPEDEFGDETSAKMRLQKLRDELERTKRERQEYLDGWQRCKADSINARKDAIAAAEKAASRAKEIFLSELLPILDSFDMATGNEAWEEMDATWKNGIEHIRNQLLDVLERNGVKRFGKVGEPFDPAKHEAVQQTDEMPGELHSIVKIVRFGYAAGDRVLRPAQVIVRS